MKIIIAPDSFKGSLSSVEVCNAIEKGIKNAFPQADIVKLPVADGGEGTLEALIASTNGHWARQVVHDPLGQKIEAGYGILGDGITAVIEMAAASGLPLVPPAKRNPLCTTTYGTGELIAAALDRGCREFIIGIGGSATTDCGAGMAQALGVKFLTANGQEIKDLMNGGLMGKVAEIDLTNLRPEIQQSRFTVACDVTNPLLGPQGSAYVYAPQKGATPEIVEELEKNMSVFIDILEATIGKSVRNIPGAGAAGGLGAGLLAFLEAQLKSGVEIVLEASHFSEKIRGADLIFTGEGKIDYQTAFGKTISGVAREAKKQNIPVIAVGGAVDTDLDNLYDLGLTSFFSICNGPMTLDEAISKASVLLEVLAERIVRAIRVNFV